MNLKKYLTLPNILCVFIAFVFIQSLPFKFSNHINTQHIFGTLGDWSGLQWFGEYGGYIIGSAELVAAILLFTVLRGFGSIIAFGLMSGAIIFHLFTPLGIVMPYFDPATGQEIGNDGGVLFMMACATWICSVIVTFIEYRQPESILHRLTTKTA
jgi:hypothetical protein